MKSMRRYMVFGLVLGLVFLISGQANAVVGPLPITINFIETATGIDVYKNGVLATSVSGEYVEFSVPEFTYAIPLKFYQNVVDADGTTLSDRLVWDFGASGTILKFGSIPTLPDITGAVGIFPAVVEDGSIQAFLSPWTSGNQQYLLYTNFQSPESAPVPIPGAVWLLGSGLIGLVGIGRKRLQK